MPATGKVVGRLVTLIVDKDDPDQEPDLVPLAGKVIFQLNVARVTELDASPVPMVIASTPFEAVLDSGGYLSTPDAVGGVQYQGIRLPANNDPDLNPTGTQYTVSYQLTVQGTNTQVTIPSHLLFLPADGQIDLATMIPPVAAPPMTIAQAEALLALAVRTINGIGPDEDGNVDVAGGGPGTVTWDDVQNKPASYPPALHSHAMSDITGLAAALLAKANQSDLAALTTEFDDFANEAELELALKANQSEVTSISQAQATLSGNVDNIWNNYLFIKGTVPEGENPTGPAGFYIVVPA